MTARQRLRAVLDARRASRPCWRCALSLPRCSSTSASKSMHAILYDEMLEREMYHMSSKSFPFHTRRKPVEPAPKIVDESEPHSSQTVRRRVAVDGQQVPLPIRVRYLLVGVFRKYASRSKMRSAQEDSAPQRHLEHLEAVRGPHIHRVALIEPRKKEAIKSRPGFAALSRKKVSSKFELDGLASSSRRSTTSEDNLPRRPLTIEGVARECTSIIEVAVRKHLSGSKWRRSAQEDSAPRRHLEHLEAVRGPHAHRVAFIKPRKIKSRPGLAALSRKIVSSIRRSTTSEDNLTRRPLTIEGVVRKCTYIIEFAVPKYTYIIEFAVHKHRAHLPEVLYEPEGDDATRLVRGRGTYPGGFRKDASKVPSEGRREDESSDDALTSLLDEYRDLPPSKIPDIATDTGELMLNTRSSIQYRYSYSFGRHSLSGPEYSASQPLLSGSRASNRQSLDLSKKKTSTKTPKATSRTYTTAASQTVQTDPQIDPPLTGTNIDGLAKRKSGSIRETLRLWQEQHDIALVNTSGRPPSSTLSDTQNLLTQSREDDNFTTITRNDEVNDEDVVEFIPDEPTLDIFARQVFLRRGDLVELVAALEPTLAIFVRNVADQCQFYTIEGEWVNQGPMVVRWAVSRFVDPDDLNEILPYLPAEEVAEEKMNRFYPVDAHAPRDTGAKVIEQMSLFHRATDAVFRNHAERINRLYDIIAPSEGLTERTYMSLKDIAMKVLMKEDPSELTQPMMWAIHRAITQSQNIIWDQMNYRQNPRYAIFPQQGLKYIHQVREWVREYQESITQETTNQPMFGDDSMMMASTRPLNPIATFVQKARSAIQESRQTRPLSKSGFVGPSSTRLDIEQNSGNSYREITLQSFDHNDKIIIHYLDVWANSKYVNPSTNLSSLGPMILRAIGMYEGFKLDQPRGLTLLQELGVIKPWENKTVHRLKGLKLPGHDSGSGEASLMLLAASTETSFFEPKDSMGALRRDWGDMPVFCIDSAETLERDDGVSLELDDNDPFTYWVHIHIANPSAFITPDSAIAKYAALLAESVYLPERKYAMLKPRLTKDRLGLAKDRPCITFSAKMSADGDILEKKITPGIVRNVYYLTPQMVAQGLGLTKAGEESKTLSLLTVGGRMPTHPVDDFDQNSKSLADPRHIEALRKLLKLGEAARQNRAPVGALDFSYLSPRIATAYPVVYADKRRATMFMVQNKNVRQYEGDPIISLQMTTGSYGPVAQMVSDLMVIAGDVGASWCAERNIPIPYRGILRNLEPACSPEVFKREVLDPKFAKYGCAHRQDLRRYMHLIGQPHTSDRPLPHLTLGLPAYCKTTSPLRRYTDLYTHWQIEAAIRHEAATGTSLVGGHDESYLPFSRSQVEEFATGALQREHEIYYATNLSNRHWICQALFRAFYFKEATLPETFEVRTINSLLKYDSHPAKSDLLNVNVSLMHCDALVREGWRVGDVWEARLEAVNPYHYEVEMEPIRLLSRRDE